MQTYLIHWQFPDQEAVWKWCQPWCKGFGNDVEVIPVLTDSEYLAVHKELD